MSKHTYDRAPEQAYEENSEGGRQGTVPGEFDPTLSEPQPRDAVYGAQWGPTPVPIQQPANTAKGAKPGALMIVGVVVLVALVALVIALVRS
jgi:hypothetical protein